MQRHRELPKLQISDLPASTSQWSLATQTEWLESVRSAMRDQGGAGAFNQDRGGLGLGFVRIREAPIGVGGFDPANPTQVLTATQELHARLEIAGAIFAGASLRRDAAAFLGAAGCPDLATKIDRGTKALKKAKSEITQRVLDGRSIDRLLAQSNRRLAKFGVELEVSPGGFVSAKAKMDDVPDALREMLQAHRSQQARPAADGDRAARLDAWRAYPAQYGLSFSDENGALRLLEADGETTAAELKYSVRGTTISLGGYGGEANGWSHDLTTALFAELLAKHPEAKTVTVDFMEGTPDFEAYVAAAGGPAVKPNADAAAVLETPLAKSLATFNALRPEVTDTGFVPGTKYIHDEPSYASVKIHLE